MGAFKIGVGLLCGVGLLAACHPANTSSNSTDAQADRSAGAEIGRLRARVETLSHQRATPDQAINSYFEAVDVQEQLSCHESAADRDSASGAAQHDTSVIADAFFHGQALESRRKYRRDLSDCLQQRSRYALDLNDVHMDTPTHATIIANVRNETPIPPAAVASDDDRRHRRDGEDFKIQLTKLADGWRIEQVYSHLFGSTEWRAQFAAEDYFPSFVLFPTAP